MVTQGKAVIKPRYQYWMWRGSFALSKHLDHVPAEW